MKKYFYTNGNDKLGPFSIEELKEKNINSETFIWYEGLSDWKKVSEISELNGLFPNVAPNIQQQNYYQQSDNTNKKNSIELFMFLAIIFWFGSYIINNLIGRFAYEISGLIFFKTFLNIIFAVVPIIFALSIKSKTKRIIAIIISIFIAIGIVINNIISIIQYLEYYYYY